LSQTDLTLDKLENGQPGKLALSTAIRLENRAGVPGGTNDALEATLKGSFDFKVDAKLLPQTLTGNARLDFARGEGAYAELAGLGGTFRADVTPTLVKELALQFERGGKALGRLQASGPLDLTKPDGRLKVEVQSIDRQVLNLFGASHGWDFAN